MTSEVIDSSVLPNDSVGCVTPRTVTLFEPPHELELAGGARLGPITVTYETYGELNAARDNAVFICHAFTGDAHAAGVHSPDDARPGWWDSFIGPGRGIDTNRWHVICANILGGCKGTTGPGSIDPTTGQRWGMSFPVITVSDIVQVHRELLQHLGIKQLAGVVGGSLGGMQVLEWATRYPESLRAAVVIASAARLSAQGIAFHTVGRRAICADPGFHSGEFYDGEGPRYGLALARMLAHITYLSEASIERKFGRRLQHRAELAYDLLQETEFQIESYLHYQGRRFVERFDANSYLYLTKAMDYFDLAESCGSLPEALGRSNARFLVVSYTTDWLFPTAQSIELVQALLAARRDVSFVEFESPWGHDSFLIEEDIPRLANLVGPFLAASSTSTGHVPAGGPTPGEGIPR